MARQTLQDSEFRLLMQGNITADPTDATGMHFAVVWFDDRNGAAPLPAQGPAAFQFALLGSSMLRWQPTRSRPLRTA